MRPLEDCRSLERLEILPSVNPRLLLTRNSRYYVRTDKRLTVFAVGIFFFI